MTRESTRFQDSGAIPLEIQNKSWAEKLKQMGGPWSSEDLIQTRNGRFKARVMEAYEAPWHEHSASDEVFIVLSGILEIDLEGGTHSLSSGSIFLVSRGTRHRARAKARVELLVYMEGEAS